MSPSILDPLPLRLLRPRMDYRTSIRWGNPLRPGMCCLILGAMSLSSMQTPKLESWPSPEQKKLKAEQADRWNNQGLHLFAEGRFAEAAEVFQKVYELFPDVPDVGYNLGLAYQQAGKYELSLEPLQRSLKHRPGDPAVLRALGVSLLHLNRLREGADQLEKSIQADPKNVDTLYNLALAYYGLKEFDRAEVCLRWMFERNPDSALLHLRTANAHRISRRYKEALAELQKALALDPNLPSLYLELGLTYIGLKNGVAARGALEEEVRRHPGSAEAQLTLGELFLLVDHDYAHAVEFIRRARELGIAPVRAEYDLGDAHLRLNQLDQAEAHLRRAIVLDPNHRRGHYLLGQVLQRQGKSSEARDQFALAEFLQKREQTELVTSFRTLVEDKEGPNQPK